MTIRMVLSNKKLTSGVWVLCRFQCKESHDAGKGDTTRISDVLSYIRKTWS